MAYKSDSVRIPVRRPEQSVNSSASIPGEAPARSESDIEEQGAANQAGAADVSASTPGCDEQVAEWRDTALRLKADMENYRKRQDRRAEDEIERERQRIYGAILEVVDQLEKTLEHLDTTDPNHQAVQMAYDTLMHRLQVEGVQKIRVVGELFNPDYHEAVAAVPASGGENDDMKVIQVVLPGYTFGNRLLRPARVVVARKS